MLAGRPEQRQTVGGAEKRHAHPPCSRAISAWRAWWRLMVRGGQPQPAAAPAASNPDPTHQRHCAGSSADTVLDVNGEGPAAGVPPLVAIGARELLSGRWARLNEQGISRAVRRPFAVEVAAAAALTQGVTRTAPAGTPAPWAPCGPTSPLGPSWPCGPRREACCVKNKATAARRSGVQCGLTSPEAQAAREGRVAPRRYPFHHCLRHHHLSSQKCAPQSRNGGRSASPVSLTRGCSFLLDG